MTMCAQNKEIFTKEMRTNSLDPENTLPEDNFKVKLALYESYPKRPTKKERERIEEQKRKKTWKRPST